MNTQTIAHGWRVAGYLIGRLVFAAVFAMAAFFKYHDMAGTAAYITSAGLAPALLLAWLAALFETALVICFLTGAFFCEAALCAIVYVLFLGFMFHGPAHWAANQAEFGFFIDHFTFAAGLGFAALAGPGPVLALRRLTLMRPASAQQYP